MTLDLLNATDEQIDRLLFEVRHEMGADGIELRDVVSAVADGVAVIERRTYGVAVLRLKRITAPPIAAGVVPHLWLLYVLPEHRSRGSGRRFVRELLSKYETTHCMSLGCVGAARRRFFGRLGFRVQARDGEYREMSTSDNTS